MKKEQGVVVLRVVAVAVAVRKARRS